MERVSKPWARVALVVFWFFALPGAPATGAQDAGRRFPETGKTVSGRFLQYWEQHGGLVQQGYPLSEEMPERSATGGQTVTVQYFERAVFEHHPENAPPYDVLLALVGAQAYVERYPSGAPGQQPNTAPGSIRFAETGKRLGGVFLAYWQAHGGLTQQGFPLSDELVEVTPLDGRSYQVQYFERAVFELHPEHAGTAFEVLLTHLGARRYQARYAAAPAGPGTVAPIAAMAAPRACHTATLLPSGKVLVAGGMRREGDFLTASELFDPATNTWAPNGALSVGRACHTATLLRDGTVLIAGGSTRDWLDSAEIYTPATGRFTPAGPMTTRRGGHTATLLPDGTVLIAGGSDGAGLASAEVYNPATRRFTPTGAMRSARAAHSATLLPGGKVLVAGGGGISREVIAGAELYDPATGTWMPTGALAAPRHKHAAHGLPGGRVLIVGGSDNRDWRGQYRSTEVYDPATGAFQANGALAQARFKLTDAVAALPGGRLLVAGGGTAVEVYDPATRRFTAATGQIDAARYTATATALADGRVLILGGYDTDIEVSAGAWLYAP